MQDLGGTRSAHWQDHLLQTPDTFVRAPLPGMKSATAIVHVGPAQGARFTQYTAEMEAGGELGPAPDGAQRFLYVLEGSVQLKTGKTTTLSSGSYIYLPAGMEHNIKTPSASKLAVIEKPYIKADTAAPQMIIGKESTVAATALNGDSWLQVRSLLPDAPEMDFAVNTMEYKPGASLSQVEIHVMEHGLLMLEGGGIYRLGDSWYSVKKGDFIWMAPYCPQWFGAIGKQPAKYLIYKDWNRHPLG